MPGPGIRQGRQPQEPLFMDSLEGWMRLRLLIALGTAMALSATLAIGTSVQGLRTPAASATSAQVGIHKIKHVIVIMQENRTFDSYFGTFPGADGIPAGVCVPDPFHGGCVKPFVDHNDSNTGGPHADAAFQADVNGGKMDGFVGQAELKCQPGSACPTDVMGHHVGSDIPN